MSLRFQIIGSGLSGAALAQEFANKVDCHIDILEEKNHIAGNCFTSQDEETGIMIHRYGPHIFNTNNKEIWDYVNRLTTFRPYVHRVKAMHEEKVFSLPINLSTLNQFFEKTFNPETARSFLGELSDKSIVHPQNFEEQALRFLGKDLYHAFFYGYTKKQWGCEPKELPASILKRLPVRFDYNDNYHIAEYTGIPEMGYTHFVEKLLDHPSISVQLNRKYYREDVGSYDHIFYTGPLDGYFNYELGRLGYRTLDFESEIHNGDYQGTAQMNYCDEKILYTRITEHKYFTPWKKFDKTIVSREYSKEAGLTDIPYYPKRLKTDKVLLEKYRSKAESLNNISFLGRLGTYRYLDMDDVIEESLGFSKAFIEAINRNEKPPVFPN